MSRKGGSKVFLLGKILEWIFHDDVSSIAGNFLRSIGGAGIDHHDFIHRIADVLQTKRECPLFVACDDRSRDLHPMYYNV